MIRIRQNNIYFIKQNKLIDAEQLGEQYRRSKWRVEPVHIIYFQ
jgi:hypothetical protein